MLHIFRIRITMPDGSSGRCTGIFVSASEAILQTQADFPDAVSVSAICIRRGVA